MSTNQTVPGRDGAKIPVLEVLPDKPGPALVMIPSIFGIGPDVVDHAKHFAKQGALVQVLDLFWRTEPGPIPFDEAGMGRAIARMKAYDPSHVANDLLDLLTAAKAHPSCTGAALALGVCYGGKFAFTAAADGHVQGAATWHGGGIGKLLDRAGDIKVPLSLDFGTDDPSIPVEEVERIRAAFADRPEVAVRLHPGAKHGFSHHGVAARYDEAAAKAAVAGVDALIQSAKAR